MRIQLTSALGLLLAMALPVQAAGDYRFAVTPLVGYQMGGDFDDEQSEAQVSLDDAAVVGLILNAQAESLGGDAYTQWELYVSQQSAGIDNVPAEVDPSLDIDITHILLGGNYIGAGEAVRPFLAAGIGAAHLSPDGADYDSDTVLAFGLGGGAMLFPDSRIGVRLEGRVLGSVIDSDSAIFCRSGPSGSGCAFRASGDMLWQWTVFAGLVGRF